MPPGVGDSGGEVRVGVGGVVAVEPVRPVVRAQHLRCLVDDDHVPHPGGASCGEHRPDRVAAHRLSDHCRVLEPERIDGVADVGSVAVHVVRTVGSDLGASVTAAIEGDHAVAGLLERPELRLPAGGGGLEPGNQQHRAAGRIPAFQIAQADAVAAAELPRHIRA
jgi:hypothetical protein